jgi:hypothetical protein
VLLGLPGAALLALALGDGLGTRLAAAFERLEGCRRGWAALAVLMAASGVGALVTGARYGLLRDTAITDDEHVYDFMARVWASGRLYATSLPPTVRAFFDNQFIVNDGRWYGIYAPGHPLVLAIGEWLGGIRWVTTIEAILTVPLAWALADRVVGRRASLLALGLLVISPFFLLMSATMLAHPTAGLGLTAFAYAAVRALAVPAAFHWWLLAGGALGLTGLTRPLAAVAFAIPLVVLLARAARGNVRAKPGLIAFTAIIGVAAALFATYNALVTGHPLRTGYQVFAETHAFTFTLGSLPAPAPASALYELFYALARLNFWLLGWPASLLLVPFARRSHTTLALLIGSGLTVAAYAGLRIPSINVVGPVHYGELAVPLVLLSASGLERIAAAAGTIGGRGLRLALTGPVALTIVALLCFWPVYGPSLRMMANVARAPYDLAEARGLDNAVVFVGSLPALELPPGAWVYRPRNNSPDLSDRVLYVNDLGPNNARLLALLPGRRAYWMGMEDGKLRLMPLEDRHPR